MNRHTVTVSVSGSEVADWESYEINVSLRQPASTCALAGPLTAKRLEAVPLGAEVQVHIDRRPVFSGYITGRQRRGHRLQVDCHDRVWRLVRDSALLERLNQDTIQALAEQLVEGVFQKVVFSNAKNRDLYGRGARRAGSEPPVFATAELPVKVPPGSTRWQALTEVLRRTDLLAWSSGDGKQLVLAKPNFVQEPRYELVISTDKNRSTCMDIAVTENITDSYRSVTVSGESRVTPRSELAYGEGLLRHDTATDASYPLPIHLVVVDEARSIQEAKNLAQSYLDDAKSNARTISITAWRHAQGEHGNTRFYTPDTVASVIDRRNGYSELVYVTSVTYSGTRTTEQTEIEAVPLKTRIVAP